MQRNIADKKTLTPLLLLGLILLYPSMEAIYPLLPPLLGIAYVKWREAVYRHDFVQAGAWMLYTLVLESVWGLPFYGTWTVMLVTFTIFDPKITQLLHMPSMIRVISVIFFDLLYLAFLYGYGALMHLKLVDGDLILLYYLLVDILGVLLF
ncbi:hypothetical protein [Hydrogenimonas cancrithermarum]|uniref:hypothetical protein n=1 Tax=Hydrogenimonas cancrithermarum TaxID=2993563 RepID=UPI0025732862|nr:hypothetical protein [Hydrogenimonas cancrithermarum]